MTVPRNHQHADHESGFRHHRHDDLPYHLHHRGPDFVTYASGTGTSTHTGTAEQVVP